MLYRLFSRPSKTASRDRHPARTAPDRRIARACVEALEPRRLLAANWASLNPGGGGQWQDLVLDPKIDGRAFAMSDVEGLYRTDNGGSSWTYAGTGLAGTDTLALAVDPLNSNRVYLGTSVGLHTSTNAGLNWSLNGGVTRGANPTLLTDTGNEKRLAIGDVVVRPVDANGDGRSDFVAASLGDKRYSFATRATVFVSADGGTTFAPVSFGPTGGDRSILQLAYGGGTTLYAAVEGGGVYKSTNFGQTTAGWTKLATPGGATDAAFGVAASPDYSKVYATYQVGGTTKVFGTQAGAINWDALDSGLPTDGSRHYATLATDPRASGATTDRLIVADNVSRDGLYEGTVNWSGAAATESWSQVLHYFKRYSASGVDNPRRSEIPWDIGWEGGWAGAQPRPLAYQYSPTTWAKNEIWTTGDQTLLKVDRSQASFQDKWKAIYTSAPQTTFSNVTINTGQFTIGGETVKTYKSIGAANTVDFDADQYGDIVVSGKGDHGVVMSWDGGATWEDMSNPSYAAGYLPLSRSNAVGIFETSPGNVYVLAHLTVGFGEGATGGQLWAYKVPDPNNPAPGPWVFLGGGNGDAGDPRGLPNTWYNGFVQDPNDKKRIYVATRDVGTFVIPDITYLYAARTQGLPLPYYNPINGPFTNAYGQPSSPGSPDDRNNPIFVDPNDSNTLYVVSYTKLYKGHFNGGTNLEQNWTWTLLRDSADPIAADVWSSGGQTKVAVTYRDSTGDRVQVSTNGGASWTNSFGLSDLTSRFGSKFNFSEVTPEIFSIAGDGNTVYAVVQKNNPENLGYGIFAVGTNGSGTPTSYDDLTGNLPLPKSFNFEVVRDAKTAKKYLMLSSWGAGTWRLDLSTVTTGLTTPAAPSGLTATAASPSQVNLTWVDNATNEIAYNVQRATNAAMTANLVTFDLPANATSYASTGLSPSTTYYYRVYARNEAYGSGYSNVASATTPAGAVGRAPDSVSNPVQGTNYAFHQADGLTSVSGLTSSNLVSTGTVNATLTAAPGRARDGDGANYGLVYTGYYKAPTTGTYTFYTNSDDGSSLSIGAQVVVSNDGLHGMVEQSGTIALQAGYHAFTVKFFQAYGGDGLDVSVAGPGVAKQAIPAASLFRSGGGGGGGQGTVGNGGQPWQVNVGAATRIQVENFDAGGEGVAYHEIGTVKNGNSDYRKGDAPYVDLSNGSAPGTTLGWFDAGEWLEYTVNVAAAGNHTLRLRGARNGTGGQFRVLSDGVDKTGTQSFGSTGGWGTYVTRAYAVNLSAGVQVIRIEKVGDTGLNLDWFEIE